MAIRFSNRLKIAPGVKLNIGKTGISTTVGAKGASVNLGKKGAHLNAGLPGTGLSSRTKISGGAGSSSEKGQVSPLFVYAVLGLLVLGLVIWIL